MVQVRTSAPRPSARRPARPARGAPPAGARRPATPRQAAACRGRLDALLAPELFKALCDPTRARLLACLALCSRPCSVGEVAECCAVDLSVVSRHLALLARAGVLEPSRQGRTVRYAVRYTHVAGALRALADALDECRPGACCLPASPNSRGRSCRGPKE